MLAQCRDAFPVESSYSCGHDSFLTGSEVDSPCPETLDLKMPQLTIQRCVLLFSLLLVPSQLFAQSEWSRWRGPEGDGTASTLQAPVSWSDSENVIWKSKISGRGHASPIVLGGQIFLATANSQAKTHSVVCLKASNGKQVWETDVHQGGGFGRVHPKNTHASSTIATDGELIFAVFSFDDAVHVTALDTAGDKVWTKKVGDYRPKYAFGYGATPIVHQGTVIVVNDGNVGAAIVAYDTKTGDQVWNADRSGVSSYSTPVVAEIGGKSQLLLSGGKSVSSYNPSNGNRLWSVPASWDVTCGTMVWDESSNMVFASGGYPSNQTLAINAKTGKKVWDNPAKVYEQSMLVHQGYLFAHADNGVLYCWRCKDGKEMWKQRFGERRVAISASPVLANGNIYFTAENGETAVVKATHKGYEEVARNRLGDETFASMAFVGGRIYTRISNGDVRSRQEWLYCLGEKK
ncbi:MAG: outer membrane protein assembly factor BamB [Mariniblastus sp.]